jgi:acetoin utilization protein AcuB
MKQDLANTLVSDCMSRKLVTIDHYASAAEANEAMQVNKIRRLPVLKKDKLVGIITQRDILNARPSEIKQPLSVDALNRFLSNILVEIVMTKEPATIYQNDTIGHAAAVMLDEKIGGIPVIDTNQKLVGLITESDIFRLIAHEWREKI